MRILITEDDQRVCSFIAKGLESELYAVDSAERASVAADFLAVCEYDLVILDLNLPDGDGAALLSSLRQKKKKMPVLILSGRSDVDERVKLLDLGADDYIVKPFSFTELSARVRALIRRGASANGPTIKCDDLEVDLVQHRVLRNGKPIDLTSKEFALLHYLAVNAGRPLTRNMILEHVWQYSFDTMTNVVDVYINYLRKKVDEGHSNKLIRTVRGVGYQFGAA